jgi:hypothetical protein
LIEEFRILFYHKGLQGFHKVSKVISFAFVVKNNLTFKITSVRIKAEESSIMLSGKGFGNNIETRGLEIL